VASIEEVGNTPFSDRIEAGAPSVIGSPPTDMLSFIATVRPLRVLLVAVLALISQMWLQALSGLSSGLGLENLRLVDTG
jgi:hypothetical protein